MRLVAGHRDQEWGLSNPSCMQSQVTPNKAMERGVASMFYVNTSACLTARESKHLIYAGPNGLNTKGSWHQNMRYNKKIYIMRVWPPRLTHLLRDKVGASVSRWTQLTFALLSQSEGKFLSESLGKNKNQTFAEGRRMLLMGKNSEMI